MARAHDCHISNRASLRKPLSKDGTARQHDEHAVQHALVGFAASAIIGPNMSSVIDLTNESDDRQCCPHNAAAATACDSSSDDVAAPPAKRTKTGMHLALVLDAPQGRQRSSVG